MAETNTISNLDNIDTLAYNDRLAVDNQNSLDIFGAPITEYVTSLQIAQYLMRAYGTATFIANCDLATTLTDIYTVSYNNGTAGVGATLTNAGSKAALVVDSVTVQAGWRILIQTQADATQNGIYTVTTVGDASTNWVLTRATDYDQAAEIVLGSFTSIQRGTTLIAKTYVQYNTGITVGSTNILFAVPNRILSSGGASLIISGTGATIVNSNGGSNITFPAGVKTLVGSGENVSFGTISSNSLTFNNGTGLKTTQTAGQQYYLSVYDVDGGIDRVFGTATAGNTPSLAFAQPAGGTLTWDGGAIGSNTPATAAFTTVTSNSHTFNTGTGLKTAQADGSTYLLSAYDVDGGADKVFMTFTAGNTPTCDLAPPSGGTLTVRNVTGITNGTSIGSGLIGEYLSANLASGSAVTLNTGVNTDIISLAYTAGFWRVDLSARVVYSGITNSVLLFFGGDTTGDNQSGVTAFNTQHIEHPAAGASGTAGGVVSYYINSSSSGTVFLKINATFTVGTATGYGAIQMVRIR
jgi:hypothetical protein